MKALLRLAIFLSASPLFAQLGGSPVQTNSVPAAAITGGTVPASVLIPAPNVTSGSFYGGNYEFPASLGVSTAATFQGLFQVGNGTMTVLANGNVGIGTATPMETLNVIGPVSISTGIGESEPSIFVSTIPGSLIGGVGILNANPQATLEVGGRNAEILVVSDAGTNAVISIQSNNQTAYTLKESNTQTGDFTIMNGAIERLHISPTSGNVGIGTTGPTSNLQVVGTTGVQVSTASTSSASMCIVGAVAALPTTGYGAGCIAYLTTDPTHIYVSTQAVVGTFSWLAK